jgi:ATP-dependent DNA ligase
MAVRFPRITRWRRDLSPEDADHLRDLKRLLPALPDHVDEE